MAAWLPWTADVTFQWPVMLWLLAVVPLSALAFAWLARRRREAARYAHLESAGAPRAEGFFAAFGRAAPPVLMLLALAALLFALARPQASLVLPARARTVMLAIDVSGSMRAGDVKPDRIGAARAAAKAFIEAQPADAKVGLVSVAATASVAQSPTAKRAELFEAIDRLQLQLGTALGSGIVISLATLLPEAGIDVQRHINGTSSRWGLGAAAPKPAPPGSNPNAAIVLVSDGQSNTGPDPLKMAQLAADHGVRIYTVGVGTPEGAILSAKGMSMRVRLDETVLKRIAEITHGDYFAAGSATQLEAVYRGLSARLSVERKRPVEVSGLLAGLGALLATLAAFVSLVRHGRIL
jgi:Ca-activated chloride channel family protein